MKKILIGIIFFVFTLSHGYIIIGHRGAAGYAPENTLSSFALAIECGVDMVEFDVWKCHDLGPRPVEVLCRIASPPKFTLFVFAFELRYFLQFCGHSPQGF